MTILAAIAVIRDMRREREAVNKAIRAALSLPPDATTEAVLAAIQAGCEAGERLARVKDILTAEKPADWGTGRCLYPAWQIEAARAVAMEAKP